VKRIDELNEKRAKSRHDLKRTRAHLLEISTEAIDEEI